MKENGCFHNGNFREYSYFAGEFCRLETGIPGDPRSSGETTLQILEGMKAATAQERPRRMWLDDIQEALLMQTEPCEHTVS